MNENLGSNICEGELEDPDSAGADVRRDLTRRADEIRARATTASAAQTQHVSTDRRVDAASGMTPAAWYAGMASCLKDLGEVADRKVQGSLYASRSASLQRHQSYSNSAAIIRGAVHEAELRQRACPKDICAEFGLRSTFVRDQPAFDSYSPLPVATAYVKRPLATHVGFEIGLREPANDISGVPSARVGTSESHDVCDKPFAQSRRLGKELPAIYDLPGSIVLSEDLALGSDDKLDRRSAGPLLSTNPSSPPCILERVRLPCALGSNSALDSARVDAEEICGAGLYSSNAGFEPDTSLRDFDDRYADVVSAGDLPTTMAENRAPAVGESSRSELRGRTYVSPGALPLPQPARAPASSPPCAIAQPPARVPLMVTECHRAVAASTAESPPLDTECSLGSTDRNSGSVELAEAWRAASFLEETPTPAVDTALECSNMLSSAEHDAEADRRTREVLASGAIDFIRVASPDVTPLDFYFDPPDEQNRPGDLRYASIASDEAAIETDSEEAVAVNRRKRTRSFSATDSSSPHNEDLMDPVVSHAKRFCKHRDTSPPSVAEASPDRPTALSSLDRPNVEDTADEHPEGPQVKARANKAGAKKRVTFRDDSARMSAKSPKATVTRPVTGKTRKKSAKAAGARSESTIRTRSATKSAPKSPPVEPQLPAPSRPVRRTSPDGNKPPLQTTSRSGRVVRPPKRLDPVYIPKRRR